MIVVRIELHSAVTGAVTELGSLTITNMGTGTEQRGNYEVKKFGHRTEEQRVAKRWGFGRLLGRPTYVFNHARKSRTVFNLLRKALEALEV